MAVTDPGATRAARSAVMRPGAASDVQHGQPRLQVGQQVSRGVLRGASLVTAQHRLVVSVGIGGPMFVVHCAVPWIGASSSMAAYRHVTKI